MYYLTYCLLNTTQIVCRDRFLCQFVIFATIFYVKHNLLSENLSHRFVFPTFVPTDKAIGEEINVNNQPTLNPFN